MIHLFIAPEQITGETARIVGPDHLHLARVLRARPGESLVLLNGRGNAFQATLVAVDKTETLARIDSPLDLPSEPPIYITVAQALGKGDKFEQVIQHGTEVGASAFVPVQAERSVVEVPAGKVAERLARWRQIARSAAEQSHRLLIPQVMEPTSLARLLAGLSADTAVLLLHPAAEAMPLAAVLRERSRQSSAPQRLLLAVGPEGGWSPAERACCIATGSRPLLVSLGTRVLRTETAALVAISQIIYQTEIDMTEIGDQRCVS
jgi:16S rRNA (uracil1498-N3)-methyltransferase